MTARPRGRRRLGLSLRAAPGGDLTDRIHPYLVPAAYPDVLTTPTQEQRSIGHGLSLALVSVSGTADAEVLSAVNAEALAAAGIALGTAYSHAERNLLRALADQRIDLRIFDNGPSGHPCVVARGHWLAATTLVAPDLFERVAAHLGDDLVAAVPDRDLLFAFPADARSTMQALTDREHQDAAKPLTSGLFSLTSDGLAPIE